MEFQKTKRFLKHIFLFRVGKGFCLNSLLPFNSLVPILSLHPSGVFVATTHCSPEIIIHGVITKDQETLAVLDRKNNHLFPVTILSAISGLMSSSPTLKEMENF